MSAPTQFKFNPDALAPFRFKPAEPAHTWMIYMAVKGMRRAGKTAEAREWMHALLTGRTVHRQAEC